MTQLTKEQAVILSAFTGLKMCKFDDLHAYIERKLGRPVFTHELASEDIWESIKEASRKDFEKLIPDS